MMKSTFGIIGGDKRQLYLAKSIMEDGYNVFISGFELSCETGSLSELPADRVAEKCDNIILPLPVTTDGRTINAPYSENEIAVDDDFIISLVNKNVFGGMMNRLIMKNDIWSMVNWGDYYLREEFAVSNAIPTAEGAIALAVQNHDGMLCGSECLVAGFGRIGKILTKQLLGMGARVYVAARKTKDFAFIRAIGATPVRYSELRRRFDIIFNTVPEIVIDSSVIGWQKKGDIIIELASLPGGIDRKAAAIGEIKVVDAQSLPGKYSPKAAGEFIKEAVYNMLEE